MIITIAGDPGSGKSTMGKKLAESLGYDRYYMGQIFRDMAKKRGMTVTEYSVFGKTHPEVDREIDTYQRNLGSTKDDFVIDGRTSWFLIPQSLKLYIAVDSLEGARRIHKELQGDNARNEGSNTATIDDIVVLNAQRLKSDDLRYKALYNKSCFEHANFDFVLDTTTLTINEAFDTLLEYVQDLGTS